DSVHCWGENDDGQLGLGHTRPARRPELVPSTDLFRAVCAGAAHTCALTDLGDVSCWGENTRGQLGLGHRDAVASPMPVSLPGPAHRLACKFRHTCALLVSGELYCWGKNGEGELGRGDSYPGDDAVETVVALFPVRVGTALYREVTTGEGHTCADRQDGTLWCWGRNSEHELGPASDIQIRAPIQVGTDDDWVAVAGGLHHTCGLRADRSLWCWGQNSGSIDCEGFPLGSPVALAEAPLRVMPAVEWTALSTHTFHTCGLARGGDLYCWGRNVEGQLGLGDTELRESPARVRTASAVDAGRFTTCALIGGSVACTGRNERGELGLGDTDRRSVFTPVTLF